MIVRVGARTNIVTSEFTEGGGGGVRIWAMESTILEFIYQAKITKQRSTTLQLNIFYFLILQMEKSSPASQVLTSCIVSLCT